MDNLPAQIHTEPALSLFSSILHSLPLHSPGPTFSSGLDQSLLLSPSHEFHRGDVVHLTGLPNSGKSQLLLFLTMCAILPPRWNVTLGNGKMQEVVIGGKGKWVVWCDCDLRLDVLRLERLLEGHVWGQLEDTLGHGQKDAVPEKLVKAQVGECLERLIIFQPSTPLHLAVTLHSLPTYLHSLPPPTPSLHYLILSSLSSYPSPSFTSPAASPALRYLLSSLSTVRTLLSPVLLISSTSSVPLPRSTTPPSLPPPFPNIFTPTPSAPLSDPLKAPRLPNSETETIGVDWMINTLEPKRGRRIKVDGVGDRGGDGDALGERERESGKGFRGVLWSREGEVGMWNWDIEVEKIDT